MRVSDVSKIVETLGGEKLYGDQPTAAIRELLQNAMDAIQARRRLQGRAPDWGTILVELAERADGVWLFVEDTGVGMSETVLVGPLIDFGASIWRSPQVAEEYPGLAAKGMDAIGRFGIGFFSVFMLGDEVRVTTRRYDHAQEDTLVLEFRRGLGSRPILRSAAPESAPIDGGTRIEIKLWGDPRCKRGIQILAKREKDIEKTRRDFFFEGPSTFPSLATLVSRLAPASDVSIDTIEFGRRKRAVTAGDWLKVSAAKLADRVSPAGAQKDSERTKAEAFMRRITTSDGRVIGRAALYPLRYGNPGVLIVGGLRVMGVQHLLGVVSGEVATAARDKGRVLLPPEALSEWVMQQAKLIDRSDLSAEHKTLCAELALRSSGSIFNLPVAKWGSKWLSSDELRHRFAHEHEVSIFVGDVSHEDHDPVLKYVFEDEFEANEHVLFISTLEYGSDSQLADHVLALLEQEWGRYEEGDGDDHIVGEADGVEIRRSVLLLRRVKAD